MSGFALHLPPVWETERLRLRPWREDDAEALYPLARDPEIGPRCGWVPHKSVEGSIEVLRRVLMKENTWAVTGKGSDRPIGSLGVFPTDFGAGKGQPEIGYWLGRAFWGRGYIPEAVRRAIGLCFESGAEAVWCAHFIGNEKSRRVIEKCGFHYCAPGRFTGADGVEHEALYYSICREERET